MNIQNVIKTAQIADGVFALAVKNAGFKSRWDRGVDSCQAVRSAYLAKVAADKALHEAFERDRSA